VLPTVGLTLEELLAACPVADWIERTGDGGVCHGGVLLCL
jgi:hypothetical protein